MENIWFYKSLATHVAHSQNIQILHLVGQKISKFGYQTLGHGIFQSTRIRRLLIQNCNLAQGKNLKCLTDGVRSRKSDGTVGTEGLKDVKSLELIDF